jgi:hypothetical protein
LVKWGFSITEIRKLPLYEYEEYIKFLNKHYADQDKSSESKNSDARNTYGRLEDLE